MTNPTQRIHEILDHGEAIEKATTAGAQSHFCFLSKGESAFFHHARTSEPRLRAALRVAVKVLAETATRKGEGGAEGFFGDGASDALAEILAALEGRDAL